MTLTITIDGVDVTDKVRLESMRLVMHAVQGQVGTGRIEVDDTTGTASLVPVATEWSVTESDATPTTIAGGYVGEDEIRRGPLTTGTQRQFRPVLEDWNTALTDRVLKGSNAKRPAETDYQRISWLIGSTALGMLGAGQIPNTNTVDMPKTSYLGKTPLDVLDDCAESAGKNFYVYFDTTWKLYYDKAGSTEAAFTSSLRVSDLASDVDGSVTFAPSGVEWMTDPERIYSGLFVQYDGGRLTRTLAATEAAYRRLQRSVVKKNFKTAKRARKWADRQLAKLDEPIKKLSLTVSVPGSALGQLRAGMRIYVKLRARGVTAFTYFRITEVDITPRQGRRGVSDVEYDVKLTMKDKIRPVNLDDDYGGGDSSGNDGTGSNDGTGGSGGGSGASVDTTEYVLDDFARTSFSAPSPVAVATTSDSGTSIDVNIPDGSDVIGRAIMLLIAWDQAPVTDPEDELYSAGWSRFGGSTESAAPDFKSKWMFRVIDGSEGFGGSGDTVTLTLSATSNVVAVAELVEDFDPAMDWSYNPGTTVDPDSLTGSGGDPVRFYAALVNDSSAITGDPTGYTEVGEAVVASQIRVRIVAKTGTNITEDPSAFTSGDAAVSYTFRLLGGIGGGWGAIPEGGGVDTEAPWEGGNTYTMYVSGAATFAVSSGVGTIAITADDTTATAELTSDSPADPSDEPEGPWASGAVFTYRWKVDVLGDTADAAPNIIAIHVNDGGSRPGLRVHLGDDVDWSYMDPDQQRGIVLFSGSSYGTFVPKTLVADTWYLTKFDFTGDTLKAKLWLASDPEPVTWDTTLARLDEASLPDEATTSIIFDGNASMTLSFESIDAALATIGYLPPGDGSTTTWYIDEWVPGSLRVWVDGISTTPASVDRDAGTFTFDRAPANGANIRAEWLPA